MPRQLKKRKSYITKAAGARNKRWRESEDSAGITEVELHNQEDAGELVNSEDVGDLVNQEDADNLLQQEETGNGVEVSDRESLVEDQEDLAVGQLIEAVNEEPEKKKRSNHPGSSEQSLFAFKPYSSRGRRMISVPSLLELVNQTSQHSSVCDQGIQLLRERRSGLQSDFVFACHCSWTCTLKTDHPSHSLPINDALVWGMYNAAVGYSDASTMLTTLDVPPPSYPLFQSHQDVCSDALLTGLRQELITAGREEAALAEQEGAYITVEGQQYLRTTVNVDCGWSKRSYGHSYNASCGVAVIIGMRTKKILFMETRNKNCSFCKRHAGSVSIPDHKCNKNWTGPSTAMESDIISKGFRDSIEMHGLVYDKFVGDGDSSVYADIIDTYPGIKVKKIECINHLIKNFNSKLFDICRNQVKGKNAPKISIEERRIFNAVVSRFGIAIRKAVDYYQDKREVNTWMELEDDIKNIPFHVFGQHKKCKAYFCKPKENEENRVPVISVMSFWVPLINALDRIKRNAKGLIEKQTTNISENFMSVAAKYTEGKRKDLSKKYDYNVRMAAAVFSYNRTSFWASPIYKQIYSKSPATPWKKLEKLSLRQRNAVHKEKAARRINFPPVTTAIGDKYYGSNPQQPDKPDEELNQEILELQVSLQVNATKQNEINLATIDQSKSPEWFKERRQRITASLAGVIYRLKPTTDNTAILNRIFNRKQWKGSDIAKQYGTFYEDGAIAKYEQVSGLSVGSVEPCGLTVCLAEGVLGSSPDGFVGETGLLEVKCPHSLQNAEPKDWPQISKANSSIVCKNGKLTMKENHNHYYQVITHIFVTGREWCDYFIWTPKGHFCQRVSRDSNTAALWDLMKTKLISFWKEDLAPELIDSRFERGYLDYRCPELRKNARLKKGAKAKNKQ